MEFDLRSLLENSHLTVFPRRNYSNCTVHVDKPLLMQRITCASIGDKQLAEDVLMVPVIISPERIYLPFGTSVAENANYHEVSVPAVQPIIQRKLREELIRQNVQLTDIDEKHRAVFADTQEFNSIQSVTFDVALRTDENMLVCAPTGAGKTLIAVLGILRELHHYKDVAEFKQSPFKIVYIAPMKALAAQIVGSLKERFDPLGINVREFTGDMHLYAEEIEDTGILVTTPEKYDTVTRRNTGDQSLFQNVRLLIIDEVHLLHGDRGPVLEAIVARTFQLKAATASRLRIIGLSATLPNFSEIAKFLHVKLDVGLFYFDWGFRPVPLAQTFIGTKNNRYKKHWDIQDEVCYNKVLQYVKKNQQVIIFVHSRASTVVTAKFIASRAEKDDEIHCFMPSRNAVFYSGVEEGKGNVDLSISTKRNIQICKINALTHSLRLKSSKMRNLKSLVESGLGFHHAGMLRDDRKIVEKLFVDGIIKVLVSTATLAWGVNFPAHAVIIKGTRMYSPSKGSQINIDLLDVQQMFGRAGRPQYDSTGEAVIITNQMDLPLYLSLLTWKIPIKSHMEESLTDHLNAEIVLGTVTNVSDGVRWLQHTFLYICMSERPDHYNVSGKDVVSKCRQLIVNAAVILHAAKMIKYDNVLGNFESEDIGRIASHTYILHQTVRIFSISIESCSELQRIIELLTKAKEYEQVKQRPEEGAELTQLRMSHCRFMKTCIPLNKVATLIQAHFARANIDNTALYLDQVFAVQNARRILRAVFDIAVTKRLSLVARQVLRMRKCLQHACWPDDHPLCQMKNLDDNYYYIVAEKGIALRELRDFKVGNLKKLLDNEQHARRIVFWTMSLPLIESQLTYYRLTPDLVRIELRVTPNFAWRKNINEEEVEPFMAWVENPQSHTMHAPRQFNIHSGQAERNDTITIEMNLMLCEDDQMVPDQGLVLHLESLHWLGIEQDWKLEKAALMKPTDSFGINKNGKKEGDNVFANLFACLSDCSKNDLELRFRMLIDWGSFELVFNLVMDRSIKKVLITDQIDQSCITILEENNIQVVYKPKLPVPEILKSIEDADGLIVRSGTTVTADIIDAAKQLKIIGRAGVGVDNIDCTAATRNGVVVINAPSGNTLSAAEHTCAMICAMSRFIPQGCASLKEEKWDRAKFMGNELHGKTLAIVGLGRIGREVAHRMQSFGMTTIGFDPLVSSEESASFGVEWLQLEEIWPRADFITLHVPLIPQTKNMINKDVFGKCKKGVRIVNVARGGIIDEEAIHEALESGQCGGLGVDVYIEEPPKEFTLIKHPKVVCTPHLGASTHEAQVKVAQEIANQFVDFVQGKPLYGTVNAPSLNEAMKAEWKAWADLLKALGQMACSISSIKAKQEISVTVHKYGKALEKDANLLLTSGLVGILGQCSDEGVNLVNVPVLATAAGITAKVESSADGALTTPSVVLEIKNGSQTCAVVGSVEGSLPMLLAIDLAKFKGGAPLRGNVLLFKSTPNQKSLASIIDAVSSFDIPITYASESESSEGDKWYLVGISKKMDCTDKVSTVSATFVAQIIL